MLLLRVFLLLFAIHGLQAYKLVCYLTNWAQYRTGAGKFMPSDVDPSLCTHLIYSFAKLSGNSLTTLEWNDLDLYKQTIDLKKANPNLKVLIAVGGWSAGSAGFSDMVTSDSSRAQFVKQAVDFLIEHDFDGLDLDWEYPGYGSGSRDTDKQQFSKLCQGLRAAFDKKNLLLTAAMAAGKSNIDNAYDIPTISKYVDFFNIMAYDYHGSWETVTGANAPLYATDSLSVSDTIDYYMKLGMPSQKIILGMGAYGRSWTLNSASTNSIGSPANAPGLPGKFTGESGYLAYYEVCQFVDQGWTRRFDQAQKMPYIFNGKQWASYDDEQSLGMKVDYLKSKNLGGAMFWAIDLDDFSGNFCKDGKFPLVNSVKSKLGGSSAPQPETSKKSSSLSTTARKTTTTKKQATTAPTSRRTSSSSGNVSCPSSGDHFYPVKGTKCARFYRCTNGVIHYFNCPSGTFFDTKIGSCNNMSAYHCQA